MEKLSKKTLVSIEGDDERMVIRESVRRYPARAENDRNLVLTEAENAYILQNRGYEMLVVELERIRKTRCKFKSGLEQVKNFIKHKNGTINTIEDNGLEVTVLTLCGSTASVFQPYSDIDRLYYEV